MGQNPCPTEVMLSKIFLNYINYVNIAFPYSLATPVLLKYHISTNYHTDYYLLAHSTTADYNI